MTCPHDDYAKRATYADGYVDDGGCVECLKAEVTRLEAQLAEAREWRSEALNLRNNTLSYTKEINDLKAQVDHDKTAYDLLKNDLTTVLDRERDARAEVERLDRAFKASERLRLSNVGRAEQAEARLGKVVEAGNEMHAAWKHEPSHPACLRWEAAKGKP